MVENNYKGDTMTDIILFNKEIKTFDDIVTAVTDELSHNDYHDEDGCYPSVNDTIELYEFIECNGNLEDDELEIIDQIIDENQNFNGIDIIDEGPGGGAFSSEADYWRYRMDPNY